MFVNCLAGSFGRLAGEALTPGNGLNIIEAPNESGKSTWAALFRVMLYGLNTRDRSLDADKRKYMPWSGAPMEGSLTLTTKDGEITITRQTDRPGNPMGQFTAVYTGTAEPVSWLSAASCGETLTGVPQEVYRRSAFIRQAGMAIDQSPALEQRIASLLTAGEEDTSYHEAAQRLKQQLHRRRVNRSTGLLPQLEREIAETQSTLRNTEELEQEIREIQAALEQAAGKVSALRETLARQDAADAAQAAEAARWAQSELEAAQKDVQALRQRLGDAPDREQLQAILRSLDNLEDTEKEAQEADKQAEDAAQRMAKAEDAAAKPLLRHRLPLLFLAAGAGVLMALAVWHTAHTALAAAGSGLGIFGLLSILFFSPLFQEGRQKAGGQSYTEAAAAWKAASALQIGYAKACTAKREAILQQVRAFSPAGDVGAARSAVTGALSLWDTLAEALRREETARLRRELTGPSSHAPAPQGAVLLSPEERKALSGQLEEQEAAVQALLRRLHTAQGQKAAMDQGEDLAVRLANMETRRSQLEEEYDALALASQVLEEADRQLQRKFSPALGESSAKIFAKLTQKKYNKVLLDTALRPSAQESGQLSPRDAEALSQGAADQLYLAVRLAICETVLPPEDPAPLILDDALVTFDDQRCAAALDYLAELGQTRQILLFTCQSRERLYLEKAHPGAFHTVTF